MKADKIDQPRLILKTYIKGMSAANVIVSVDWLGIFRDRI